MFKPKKGSVLVFSLIILSIILSAAITVATVSVTNQRSASSTGKSVQSFQVADSGIELALQKIYKGNYATLNALATGMGGAASCTGGSISKSNVVGGDIKVSFYDNDGNLVTCTDTDWRDKVVRIKSEGSAFGTTRVVETAVAANMCRWSDVPLSDTDDFDTNCLYRANFSDGSSGDGYGYATMVRSTAAVFEASTAQFALIRVDSNDKDRAYYTEDGDINDVNHNRCAVIACTSLTTSVLQKLCC